MKIISFLMVLVVVNVLAASLGKAWGTNNRTAVIQIFIKFGLFFAGVVVGVLYVL